MEEFAATVADVPNFLESGCWICTRGQKRMGGETRAQLWTMCGAERDWVERV